MRRFLNSLELPGVEMVAAAAAATAEVPDQRKPREFADLLKMEIFFVSEVHRVFFTLEDSVHVSWDRKFRRRVLYLLFRASPELLPS